MKRYERIAYLSIEEPQRYVCRERLFPAASLAGPSVEILFEVLAAVLQILAEIVLQIIFEGLAELGLRSLREPFHRPEPLNAVLAGGGYLLLGCVAGGISLWLFPTLFIRTEALRIANLLVTPFIAGLAMSVLGAWRATRGQEIIRLDRFAYGYLFALAMAVVRAVWGG